MKVSDICEDTSLHSSPPPNLWSSENSNGTYGKIIVGNEPRVTFKELVAGLEVNKTPHSEITSVKVFLLGYFIR